MPRLAESFPSGIDRLLRGDWTLLLTCCLHAAVVLTIVAWGLLEFDGCLRPRPLAIIPIVLALAFVAAVPVSGPGGLLPDGSDWPSGRPRAQALCASLLGAVAGWTLGRGSSVTGIRLGLPLLGSVLGWQIVTIVAVVTIVATTAATAARVIPKAAAGLLLAAVGTVGIALQGPLRDTVAAVLGNPPGR